jgi:hypothetical protein
MLDFRLLGVKDAWVNHGSANPLNYSSSKRLHGLP